MMDARPQTAVPQDTGDGAGRFHRTLGVLPALAGWIYVSSSAGRVPIELSVAWVVAGVVAFLVWARVTRVWPFGPKQVREAGAAAQP